MSEKTYAVTGVPIAEEEHGALPAPPNSELVTVTVRELGKVVACYNYEIVDIGSRDSKKVVAWIGGSPIGALDTYPSSGDLDAAGIRLVGIGKPGYGLSTDQPGRKVSTAAGWVEDVMTGALGIEQYALYGRSGGGPHALAAAALLPHHVKKVAALSSSSPYHSDGLWESDMSNDNKRIAALVAAGDDVALYREYEPIRRAILQDDMALFKSLEGDSERPLSPDVLSIWKKRLIGRAHQAALKEGVVGWVRDSKALFDPDGWEVALEDIQCRTLLVSYKGDQYTPAEQALRLLLSMGKEGMKRTTLVEGLMEESGAHFRNFDITDAVLYWLTTDNPESEKRVIDYICKVINGVVVDMTGIHAFA